MVGTFLWVVNAVKAQNQAEQEGAPPDAEPGGRRISVSISHIHIYIDIYIDWGSPALPLRAWEGPDALRHWRFGVVGLWCGRGFWA